MDKVTKSLLDEFVNAFSLKSDTEAKAFEKFVNYTIISNEYSTETLENYEIEQSSIGDNGDLGIDGIGILVNGKLISSKDEIDDLLEINGFLDVTFIFNQAKTSSSFNSSEIGTFLFGVDDFFSAIQEERVHPYRNKEIMDYIELTQYLYDHSSKMDNQGLPILKLYYVTTGTWNKENKDAISRFETFKQKLLKTKLFLNIEYFPLGADEIQKQYRATKGKLIQEILFINKITLPEIKGIKEAYFGVIPFSEYKKLIIDDLGNIKNVFYDNIRSFQGFNLVNKQIDKTLKEKKFDLFTVLNNGITIIARSITPAGNKFTLRDYQIVNGCQTSHVLFHNKKIEGIEKIEIPIRVVVSDNEDVKKQVIIATNSQTEVKQEQLIALLDYQKKLESYYDSINGAGKLYYERRSKQFNGEALVPKSKVVTIPMQIVSFTSMFLDEPHNVRGYYGKIIENIEKAGKFIFAEEHHCAPYHTSALAYIKLEQLFQSEQLPRSMKKAKFHLLLAFRFLAEEKSKPKYLNDNAYEKYCEVINNKLIDDTTCKDIFKKANEIISSTVPGNTIEDWHINRLLTMNIAKKLRKELNLIKPEQDRKQREQYKIRIK